MSNWNAICHAICHAICQQVEYHQVPHGATILGAIAMYPALTPSQLSLALRRACCGSEPAIA
jgi:hypothetical protein